MSYYRLMKLEFRTHALHFSFEKFRKRSLRNSYSILFKQIHVYINYIFLIKKFSRQKKTTKKTILSDSVSHKDI